MPIDSRSNDRWFQHIAIIVRDMDEAYRRLRKHKVEHASTGPQRLPESIPAAAGIQAFYFKDPDGHVLQVLQFPEGKGDAKWHQALRLFSCVRSASRASVPSTVRATTGYIQFAFHA